MGSGEEVVRDDREVIYRWVCSALTVDGYSDGSGGFTDGRRTSHDSARPISNLSKLRHLNRGPLHKGSVGPQFGRMTSNAPAPSGKLYSAVTKHWPRIATGLVATLGVM